MLCAVLLWTLTSVGGEGITGEKQTHTCKHHNQTQEATAMHMHSYQLREEPKPTRLSGSYSEPGITAPTCR